MCDKSPGSGLLVLGWHSACAISHTLSLPVSLPLSPAPPLFFQSTAELNMSLWSSRLERLCITFMISTPPPPSVFLYQIQTLAGGGGWQIRRRSLQPGILRPTRHPEAHLPSWGLVLSGLSFWDAQNFLALPLLRGSGRRQAEGGKGARGGQGSSRAQREMESLLEAEWGCKAVCLCSCLLGRGDTEASV